MSWTATTGQGSITYQLEEDTASGFTNPTVVYTGANLSHSFTNHSPGTYYYRVRAQDSIGWSAWTVGGNPCVVTVPPPAPPASITVPQTSATGSFTVSWAASTGATTYQLQEANNNLFNGANTVYITDSAGYMLPQDVTRVVALLRENLAETTEIGFHGHNNMGMAIANSIAAVEAGATRIDASVGGLGAGAGNTPTEAFVAVCDRMGIATGCDLFSLMDMAEEVVFPMMEHIVRVDRSSLTMGYAGVYSTFLLHANRIGNKYGIAPRDILVELGRRKMIGGQEDMIEDTALTMAKERGLEIAVVG